LTFPPSRSARTEDDVGGLTIDRLTYESKEPVAIGGQGLILGPGGLLLDTPENGYNPLSISSPIALADDQTWTSVSSGGGWGSEPVLEVPGSLSGEQSSLTIDLKSQRALVIGGLGEPVKADDEVGNTMVDGTESIDPLTGLHVKTRVELIKADFNTVDGNRLTVDDVALQSVAGTGPITAIDSSIAVIGGGTGPLTLVSSVLEPEGVAYLPDAILDAASSVDFRVEATAEPPVQYNELSSTGSVSLGDSELDLTDHEGRQHECPSPNTLPVTTLISAAAITGEFSNAPNGAVIPVRCIAPTERTYQYRIDYNRASTPQTVTVTPLAEPAGSATAGGSTGGSSAGAGTSRPSGVGRGATPGGAATTISSARLLALLDEQLTPNAKTTEIGMLLKSGGYSERVEALEAGVERISWYEILSGGRRDAKTEPRPVSVASGRLVFAAAGRGKLKILLTAAGRKLLERSETLRLTAEGTFTPASGASVSGTKEFVLKG
jgi:hypothetical protein